MQRAAKRRRRAAAGTLSCLAILAFVIGMALGKPAAQSDDRAGESDAGARAGERASDLTPGQLAGERIIVGLSGPVVPPDLKPATARHFPGLGAGREDTDLEVGRIGLAKAQLRRVDEAPYAAYARLGGDMAMVSTAIYPAFHDAPAAFSRALVSGELRERLGYRGVVMTDALNTVAVGAFGGPVKSGMAAAGAGCDLLLYTDLAPAERARGALARALRLGALDRGEFEAAAERVLALRAQLPR